jgi:hypothetical protein
MLASRAMELAVVREVGTKIQEAWQAVDHDPRQLPDIATRELRAADLPGRLTPDQIIDWALGEPTLPKQYNLPATFGQPPVTLFRSRRFYIESLFWLDASTSIHEHGFSGAFQVLAGSSIETRYSFEPQRTFDGHFVLGRLAVASTSLLRRGDVRSIASGPGRLVHALFHLERPSVTIVVRTNHDADAGPQLTYARPGIGFDPFYKEETFARGLEVVALLRNLDHADLEAKVGALVHRSDLHAAFRILGECQGHPDRAMLGRLVERLRDPSAVDVFRAAFEELRRLKFLVSRRALVKETDLRFFLGVLLNVHRRQDVLALVRAYAPDGDPAARVAAWTRRLSTTALKLQAAGTPWIANVLGLPELDDALERALAEELAGAPRAEDERAARFLAALRAIPALVALFG